MKIINKIDGIELLQMIANDELECGTMIRHKRDDLILTSNPPQPVYEYYKYTAGDKRFHRCDERGKLGSKGQQRFMNYGTLNKEFEIVEIDKELEAFRMDEYAFYVREDGLSFKPITEEEQDIKEVLEIELLGQCDNWLQRKTTDIKLDMELNPYILKVITRNFELLYNKQCELIKAVNELKKNER